MLAQKIMNAVRAVRRKYDDNMRFWSRVADDIFRHPKMCRIDGPDAVQLARLYLDCIARGFVLPHWDGVRRARQTCLTFTAFSLEDQRTELLLRSRDERVKVIDRLLAVEQLLLGVEAELWCAPEEWSAS